MPSNNNTKISVGLDLEANPNNLFGVLDSLDEKIRINSKRIDDISKSADKSTNSLKENAKAQASVAKETEKTTNATTTLGTFFNTFNENLQKATSGNIAFLATLNEAEKGLNALKNIGFDFSASLNAFKEFSNKLTEVSTLLGADGANQVKQYGDEIRKLATTFGQDATVQAAALYQTISSGVVGVEKSMEALTVANKLAKGGATDVFTAVDGLTSVLNAYGLSANESTNISDTLFVAMKRGKTTIKELSDNIGNVIGIAAQAGISLEEFLGAVATITLSGKSTAEAMTALKGVLTSVISPSQEAAIEASNMGIQFNTAAIRAMGLAPWLQELSEKAGGTKEGAKALDESLGKLFGNVRGLGGVMSLTGEGMKIMTSIMDDMGNKAGATTVAYDQSMDTLSSAEEQLAAAFNELQITAGEQYAPAVKMMSLALADFLTNNKDTLSFLFNFTTATGALGLSVVGLSKTWAVLSPAITAFNATLTGLTTTTGIATAATGTFTGILGGLKAMLLGVSSPIGILLTLLTAGTIAFNTFAPTVDTTTKSLDDLKKISKDLSQNLNVKGFDDTKQQLTELTKELDATNKTIDLMSSAWGTAYGYSHKTLTETKDKSIILAESIALLQKRFEETKPAGYELTQQVKKLQESIQELEFENKKSFSTETEQKIKTQKDQLNALDVQVKALKESEKELSRQRDEDKFIYDQVIITQDKIIAKSEEQIAIINKTTEQNKISLTTQKDINELAGDTLAVKQSELDIAQNEYLAKKQIAEQTTIQLNAAKAELDAINNRVAHSESLRNALAQEITEKEKAYNIAVVNNNVAKEEANSANLLVEKAKLVITTTGDQSASIAKLSKELEIAKKAHEETTENIEKYKNKLEEAKQAENDQETTLKIVRLAITEARKDVENYTASHTEGVKILDKQQLLHNNLTKEIEKQTKARNETVTTLSTYNDVTNATVKKMESEGKSLAEINTYQKERSQQLEELKGKLNLYNNQLDALNETHKTSGQELNKLKEQHKDLIQSRETLNKAVEYAKPIEKSYADQQKETAETSKQLNEEQEKQKQTRLGVAVLSSQLKDAENDYANSLKNSNLSIDSQHESLLNLNSSLSLYEAQVKTLQDESDRLDTIQKNSIETQKNLKEVEIALTQAKQNARPGNTEDQKLINDLTITYNSYKDELAESSIQLANQDVVTQSLNDAKKDLKKKQEEVAEAAKKEQESIKFLNEDLERDAGLSEKRSSLKVKELEIEAEAAKAKGNTKLATELLQDAQQEEINQLDESISVKTKQVDLAYKAAEAKYIEANADGEYTEAERAAVEAMYDAAEAAGLIVEETKLTKQEKEQAAEKARIYAEAMDVVNAADEKYKDESPTVAAAAKEVGQALADQGASAQEVSWAMSSAAQEQQKVVTESTTMKNDLIQNLRLVGQTARESMKDLGDSFKVANDYFNQQMFATVDYRNQLHGMGGEAERFHTILVRQITQQALHLAELDKAQKEMTATQEKLNAQYEAGNITTSQYAQKLEQLRLRYKWLGDEKLSPLNDALQSAIDKTKELEESAKSALQSALQTQQELFGVSNDIEIENIEWQKKKAELQEQLQTAKNEKDNEAIKILERVIQIEIDNHNKRLEQIQIEIDEKAKTAAQEQQQYNEIEQSGSKAYKTIEESAKNAGRSADMAFASLPQNFDSINEKANQTSEKLGSVARQLTIVHDAADSIGGSGLATSKDWLDKNTESAQKTNSVFGNLANSINDVHDTADNIGGSGLATSKKWLDENIESAQKANNVFGSLTDSINDVHDTADKVNKSAMSFAGMGAIQSTPELQQEKQQPIIPKEEPKTGFLQNGKVFEVNFNFEGKKLKLYGDSQDESLFNQFFEQMTAAQSVS